MSGRLGMWDTLRLSVTQATAVEVSKRYEAAIDLNPLDGCYAAVVRTKHTHRTLQVSGWIFESKSEAKDFADFMLVRLAGRLADEAVEQLTPSSLEVDEWQGQIS